MNTTMKLAVAAVAAVICASQASQAQTPAPAARPDFNGIWGGGVARLTPTFCNKKVDAFANDAEERFAAGGAKGGAKWITFEQDCGIQNRGRMSKPQYKPQYWERIRMNDLHANTGGKFEEYADPEWTNFPRGVPRLGPPNKIAQNANEVIFMWENQNQFKVIPTDCREHDPVLKFDQSTMGLGVGCWEGNTLVITSMGFTDRTWLHWSGYSHSAEMVVVERLRREGDTLIYQATIQDPEMFLEPWVQDTQRLNLNKTPGVQLLQDVPYNDRSLGALTDPAYRG